MYTYICVCTYIFTRGINIYINIYIYIYVCVGRRRGSAPGYSYYRCGYNPKCDHNAISVAACL